MKGWIVFLLATVLLGCSDNGPEHSRLTAEGDAVRIPRPLVDDGEVHFFTYEYDGKNVNFLVRSDGEGRLHTHLDACYSCYRYRRGFVVEEGELLCIACRLSYPLADETWDFIGACAPIPIHFTLTDDELVVERALLERAARYF